MITIGYARRLRSRYPARTHFAQIAFPSNLAAQTANTGLGLNFDQQL
jgi:hypothetical protein